MELTDFVQRLFEAGQQRGFGDMEVYYEREEQFGCGLYEGAIDSYESSEVAGISFRGVYDGQMGYAFTERIDEDSIPYLLDNAKENALTIEDEDIEEVFPGSSEYHTDSYYSEVLEAVTTEEKIAFLKDVENAIVGYDQRITGTEYCMLGSSRRSRVLTNSYGLSLEDRKNDLGLYISVIVKDKDQIKTGSFAKTTTDFHSLNAADVAREACVEALTQLGSQSIASRAYPVLLRNDMAATLLQTFSPIFFAENVQKGRSLLKGKLGTVIGAELLSIVDNPFLPGGLASRNFDAEGFATNRLQVIEGGKLLSLLHNRKTARKDGIESTGHAYKSSYKGSVAIAPTNFYVEPSNTSYDEIVAGITDGVLITDLSGLHSGANPVSGDFSLAAKGFYIRDGKVAFPVNQMTVAGNFFEVLMNIETIASDLEFAHPAMGTIGSPSLLVNNLNITVE